MIYASFYIGLVLFVIVFGAYRMHNRTWGKDDETTE